MPQDDRKLDALVRQSAERVTDEAALTRRVLARIAADRRASGRTDWLFAMPVPRAVPAAFAVVLAATPFAMATIPMTADPVDLAVIGLATGAPDVLLPGLASALAGRDE
jgi:hypothetical protein